MQYLIICDGFAPAYTKWFDAENNFNADVNMVVFDLFNHQYTDDGKTWKDISFDHL